MAFDFPSSGLTVGQVVTGPNNTSYTWDGTKWAASVSGTSYLPITGGTLTGDLNIRDQTPAIHLNVIPGGTSPTNQPQLFGQNNGVNRWSILPGNNEQETGSDAGSNFALWSCTDAGAYKTNVLGINRASGLVTVGNALQVNQGATVSGTVNAGAFSGNSFNSQGNNSGYFFTSRGGTGDTFGIYTDDGANFHVWESNGGNIVDFSRTGSYFQAGLTVATAPQLRMVPNSRSTASYGSMWYNDGGNTYLLLTNNNDAQGGWNSLRPFYVVDSNGAVNMNQGVTITGGCSVTGNMNADNVITRGWGIQYSNYASNWIAFQWTGSCQLFVDNNNNGTLITSSNWTSYIPNANNNPAGCVLRSGDTMSGRLTVPTITLTGIGIIYSQFNGTNNIAFKWASGLQEYIDGTYQGTIQASCDARTKYNRAPPEIHDPLGDILQINLESFDQELLKGDPLKHVPIGFIAQNLQAIGEDMVDVGYVHDEETGEETDETRLAVATLPMFARLVGALQQQQQKIEELEARIAALEARPTLN